jgi:hypothetical protein
MYSPFSVAVQFCTPSTGTPLMVHTKPELLVPTGYTWFSAWRSDSPGVTGTQFDVVVPLPKSTTTATYIWLAAEAAISLNGTRASGPPGARTAPTAPKKSAPLMIRARRHGRDITATSPDGRTER